VAGIKRPRRSRQERACHARSCPGDVVDGAPEGKLATLRARHTRCAATRPDTVRRGKEGAGPSWNNDDSSRPRRCVRCYRPGTYAIVEVHQKLGASAGVAWPGAVSSQALARTAEKIGHGPLVGTSRRQTWLGQIATPTVPRETNQAITRPPPEPEDSETLVAFCHEPNEVAHSPTEPKTPRDRAASRCGGPSAGLPPPPPAISPPALD